MCWIAQNHNISQSLCCLLKIFKVERQLRSLHILSSYRCWASAARCDPAQERTKETIYPRMKLHTHRKRIQPNTCYIAGIGPLQNNERARQTHHHNVQIKRNGPQSQPSPHALTHCHCSASQRRPDAMHNNGSLSRTISDSNQSHIRENEIKYYGSYFR